MGKTGVKKRGSKKTKKETFLQIRIETELKADFESVTHQNVEQPSTVIRSWIREYLDLKKYSFFEIKTKEIYVLVRAISERSAVNRLHLHYQQENRKFFDFDVTHCRKVDYPKALSTFIHEAVHQTPLATVDDLLDIFNSSELILFEKENLFYITTKEQIELDIKRASEALTKGLSKVLNE
ncbi:hypothetical protein ABD87_22795 [Lysinibacillus sphaericus]|uniref:hypothetical protein n=1 Tax=Lysinibacillus sphaericus TaxID=1421 RepID=UPI0018CCC62F|nr:hypothetical protein [Lysinibacillus sphaericus]MBG9732256.1 hypothetical protein [Lysinibacillus sphaericus]